MAAEATASSSDSTDQALIAEIAPAMLKKLERDGLEKGILQGLSLIVLSLALQQMMLHSEFKYRFAVMFAGIAVAIVGLAALPVLRKKRNVAGELHYRRQHGKWRWER